MISIRRVVSTPTNLRSFEEFRQLPILTKDDIRLDQEAHPPWGSPAVHP